VGGEFTSRVNMNLREDKHWSYGSHSMFRSTQGQRPFVVLAPVQSDKTKEAVAEIEKELKAVTGDKPVTEEEFSVNQKKQVLELAGRWQSMGAVRGAISEIVSYRLPDDYFQKYSAMVKAVDLEQARKAAKQVIQPEKLTWVIVGDLAKIEPGIRELNLGELHHVDADGNVTE
jgi:zinc protease